MQPVRKVCIVSGCAESMATRGLCFRHYTANLRQGDPLGVMGAKRTTCISPDCAKPAAARGLCPSHYQWHRRHDSLPERPVFSGQARKPCSETGCAGVSFARGWCVMHYARWRRHGNPQIVRQPHHPVQAVDDDLDSLLSRTTVRGDCRVWLTPERNPVYRYPFATLRGEAERVAVRRVMWQARTGHAVPQNTRILTLCDHTWCVEPAHLLARPSHTKDLPA